MAHIPSRWRTRAGQLIVAALVILFTVVPGARPAAACSCGYDPDTLADVFARSDVTAFVGRAVSVTEPTDPNADRVYTFAVDQSLKGYAGPTIEVKAASGALCGGSYPLNVPLGVTLYGDKDRFTSSLCDPHSYTLAVGAFLTWFSGTLPKPTGSGPIAGYGRIGPETWGVVDKDLRILGYIPLRSSALEESQSCPGNDLLAGLEYGESGSVTRGLVVNLSTLRTSYIPEVKGDARATCTSRGGYFFVWFEEGSDTIRTLNFDGVDVSLVSEGRPIAGSMGLPAPTPSNQLVWVTTDAVVVTDQFSLIESRRIPIPQHSEYWSFADDIVFVISADLQSQLVVDTTTGSVVTVPNKLADSTINWQYSDNKMYRLLSATRLEVVDVKSGTRSETEITNGPSESGWELIGARGDRLLLVQPGADAFYSVDGTGTAIKYAQPEVAPANATSLYGVSRYESYTAWADGTIVVNYANGHTWQVSPTGAQPVLDGFAPELVPFAGPLVRADACGITAIPTLNYICEPPTLPPTL